MGLHGAQLSDFATVVEEHAAHDLAQNLLGSTGDAGIVEQVALLVFGLGIDIVGQPAHQGVLVEAAGSLQEFHTAQHTAELILPTTAGGEQLFEHQGAPAYLGLVPRQ